MQQPPAVPSEPSRSPWPFIAALTLEALFVLALIVGRRGVIGHDAFQYFGLQYTFLSNATASGETAEWMPFITHGTVSSWWYSGQASLVQASLLALGPLTKLLSGVNFLGIYYAGFLFDSAVYLLGLCLLSRRYFKSDATVLFVAVTAIGSCVYFTQPWYGIHFFYTIPLILECLHRFVERRRWRYAALAGNLLALQGLGNLPYQLPMIALTVFLYVLTYAVLYRKTLAEPARELLSRPLRGLGAVILVAGTLGLVYGMLTAGMGEVANYNVGRNPDGSVESLKSFLTYGNNARRFWLESLTRTSIYLDYNLYFGILAFALAVLGLKRKPSREHLLLLITTGILLLVSLATPLSAFFYYTFPLMKYYRHLSLVSLIIRMFLALLAGFGFERWVVSTEEGEGRSDRRRLLWAAGILVTGAMGVLLLSFHPRITRVLHRYTEALPPDPGSVSMTLARHALVEGAICLFVAGLYFAALRRPGFRGRWAILVALAFQALDLYAFKGELAAIRTVGLTEEQNRVNVLQESPYSARRTPIDYSRHPRARLVPQVASLRGALYWSTDSYLFVDPPSNFGRTDCWLQPLDDYLRAFHADVPREAGGRPIAFQIFGSMVFPSWMPAAEKLSGVTEDKIQFFSAAHALGSDAAFRSYVTQWDFSGDLLFVRPGDGGRSDTRMPDPTANERIQRRYRVLRFDANHMEIEVEEAAAGEWLYYADVWHPGWTATVNGKETPVAKANLAYKAVPLNAGKNVVAFRYRSGLFIQCARILNWNSLLWVVLLLGLMAAEGKAAFRRFPRMGVTGKPA